MVLMLPFIVLGSAIVFLLLWQTGLLDELVELGRRGARGDRRDSADEGRRAPRDPDMARRLEVFERFIENLSRGNREEDDSAQDADS